MLPLLLFGKIKICSNCAISLMGSPAIFAKKYDFNGTTFFH